MNRKALEQPFPPDQIKHRQGNFGNTLAYLEAHTVIQRLNNALDAAWSFEVVNHQVLQDEVIVLGKLTAGGVVKTQFGSSTITRNKSSAEVISLGDDLKAATTDALKKAATLLGVGNYLYAGEVQTQGTHPAPYPALGQARPPGPNLAPGPAPGQAVSPEGLPNNHQQNNNGGYPEHAYQGDYQQNRFSGQKDNQQDHLGGQRISSKQFNYILSIAKEKGITQKELNDSSVNRFGAKVEFLAKRDASSFIEDLLKSDPGSSPGPVQQFNKEAVHA